jgi:hypothetical protein
MKLNTLLANAAASASLLCAGAAHATLYQFDISGAYTAQWRLDSAPAPDEATNGAAFTLWDVEGAFARASTDHVDLTFFNGAQGGGMGIEDFRAGVNLLFADGRQLYGGPEEAPVFVPGRFALTDFQGQDRYTLTVTEVAPVPEPSTGAVMVAGLALVFGVTRRRRAPSL